MSRLHTPTVYSGAMRALAWILLIAPWLIFSAVASAEQPTCPTECLNFKSTVIAAASIDSCDTTPGRLGLRGRPVGGISIGSAIIDTEEVERLPTINYLYQVAVAVNTSGLQVGRQSECLLTMPDGSLDSHELTIPEAWACIRDLNDTCRVLGF